MPQACSSVLKGKLRSQGTEAKEKPGLIPHDSTPQGAVTRTGTASSSMPGLMGSRSQPSKNRAARPEGCEILDAVPDGTPILLGDTAESAITHVIAGMSPSQLIEALAQMKVPFPQNSSGPTSSHSWFRILGICNYSSPLRPTVAFAPPTDSLRSIHGPDHIQDHSLRHSHPHAGSKSESHPTPTYQGADANPTAPLCRAVPAPNQYRSYLPAPRQPSPTLFTQQPLVQDRHIGPFPETGHSRS
ncbi:hypothetical protein B0H13DRAFT_1881570 [Mycena leptocephala]|nr:hypothetical protein B0H13DRAFT_1881570 [Mycena leptocephala]